MIYNSSNWSAIRRIGIGDRQHIRGNVFSIGCFHAIHLEQTIEGCYMAGVELGMITRIHINAARQTKNSMERITRIVHRFMQFDAQLMEHGAVDVSRFTEFFETCELIVQPLGEPNVPELVDLIKFAWRSSGERFLGGNFARLSDDALRIKYPDLWPDSAPFYKDFTNDSAI